MLPDFQELRDRGFIVMGTDNPLFIEPKWARNFNAACDAQPVLVGTANAGIPAYLTTLYDPKLIETVYQPMKAAKIVSATGAEIKKGNWLTETVTFESVEYTGHVSTYGDYSRNGQSGVNANFISRQSYGYQTFVEYGEKEMERAGLAKIDLAMRKRAGGTLVLNKFQNMSYFYGISGLQNYGLLNDSHLPSAISPSTKAAGGTTWALGIAVEIYNDFLLLFKALQTQSGGNVETDTPLVMALSPTLAVNLLKVSPSFYSGTTVQEVLKKNFPNLRIETAPEYSTTGGELIQLIVETLFGQQTVDVAFTEKMRAHATVVATSSFEQKLSQGTWGAIIYRPFLIAQGLGY